MVFGGVCRIEFAMVAYMTELLMLLLFLAVIGLGLLGYVAFILRAKAANVGAELNALQVKYESDVKRLTDYSSKLKIKCQELVDKYNESVAKWNKYTTAMKAENERLSKWKNVANAEVKAAELLSTAQATWEKAPALEQRLHEHFVLKQLNKVNHRKEFFRVSLKDIREEIEKLGLNGVPWTMTAVAKEYRETLATEKKIADDPTERENWIGRHIRLERVTADDELELVGASTDE